MSAVGKHAKPKQDCSACGGTGKQDSSDNGKIRKINCVVCGGTGKV